MAIAYDIRRETDRSLVVAGIRGVDATEAFATYVGWFKPEEGMVQTGPTTATASDGTRLIITPKNRPQTNL